jgi:alpha-glucosidase
MFGAVDSRELARSGVLKRYWQTGPTLFADYGGPLLAVTLLSADMIRVRLAPGGIFAPRRSWAVTRPDKAYTPPTVTIEEDSEYITLLSGHLAVRLTREGGRIRIEERASGRAILDDGQAGGPAWDSSDDSAAWTKRMPPDERYYGFGERTGLLDKRGRRYTCWTTDASIAGIQ